MKNLNLHIILFCMMITSTLVYAKTSLQGGKLRVSNHLREIFTHELERSTGMKEFHLKVDVTINEDKLFEQLGGNVSDREQYSDIKLPGLYLEGQEQFWKDKFDQANMEDILLSLSTVKMSVQYNDVKHDEAFIKSSIYNIVASVLPSLAAGGLKLDLSKSVFNNSRAETQLNNPNDTLVETLKKPLNVALEEGSFTKFLNDYYAYLIGGVFLLLGLFYLSQNIVLKRGFNGLVDVIKNRASKSQAAASSAPRRAESTSQHIPDQLDLNSFKSYVEASQYLKDIAASEPRVFEEVLLLKFMAEDFSSIIVLMDVIPKSQREGFINNMEQEKRLRLKNFILDSGSALMKDDASMRGEAVKLIKLIKIASYSPGDLTRMVLSDICQSLDMNSMEKLLVACTQVEQSILVDFIAASNLALYVQSGTLAVETIQLIDSDPSHQDLLDIVIKASMIVGAKKSLLKREKLEEVYAQLETSKAEMLADTLGISSEFRLEYLFNKHSTLALEYLEALEFDELSALFCLLTEEMQEKLRGELPELLSERLNFSKKVVTHASLQAKGEFYKYLRSLSLEDIELRGTPELKLVA
jgi:hypothetical protein